MTPDENMIIMIAGMVVIMLGILAIGGDPRRTRHL